LNAVISGVIEKVETEFCDWDFSVQKSLDNTLKPIRIDRDLFARVLFNLVENGLHRMGRKGVMRIGTRKRRDSTRLTLAYLVPHISSEDIESFFYPFAVAYPFAGGGTDEDIMDLPMSKVIIHKHGGLIEVNKEGDNIVKIVIDLPGG
jgi:K+-sensing histidine kinase KdpD